MFGASSVHLQEDTVVHMQHMVLSLSMRVLGGLSVHSLSAKHIWPSVTNGIEQMSLNNTLFNVNKMWLVESEIALHSNEYFISNLF